MNNKFLKRILSLALSVALVFSLTACKGQASSSQPGSDLTQQSQQTQESLWDTALYTQDTEMGQGEKTVYVTFVLEDKSIVFTIKTDKENLGDALVENNLAEGEKGEYGLYVTSVNGVKAIYDDNGAYWALSKEGEYTTYGVDGAEIAGGEKYELTYTI